MRAKPYMVATENGFRAFRSRQMAEVTFRDVDGDAILTRFDENDVQHILDTNVSRKPPYGSSEPSKG